MSSVLPGQIQAVQTQRRTVQHGDGWVCRKWKSCQNQGGAGYFKGGQH